MEYVRERGVFDDLPLNTILTELRHTYGQRIFERTHVIADAFTDTPDRCTQPDGIARGLHSLPEAR